MTSRGFQGLGLVTLCNYLMKRASRSRVSATAEPRQGVASSSWHTPGSQASGRAGQWLWIRVDVRAVHDMLFHLLLVSGWDQCRCAENHSCAHACHLERTDYTTITCMSATVLRRASATATNMSRLGAKITIHFPVGEAMCAFSARCENVSVVHCILFSRVCLSTSTISVFMVGP
eukprot:jgi/Ulvmu1/6952/UM033_0009.1